MKRFFRGTPYEQMLLYTYSAVWIFASFAVFVIVTVFLDSRDWGPFQIGALILGVVAAGLACEAAKPVMIAVVDGTPVPQRRLWVILGITAVAIVFTLLGGGGYVEDQPWQAASAGVAALVAIALSILSVMLPLNVLAAIAAAGAALTGLALYFSGLGIEPNEKRLVGVSVATSFSAFLILGGLAASIRMSVWMLERMKEQERAGEMAAQLAVADERLRFSRDLHDIFGRTLTAVTLKSDLAASLAEAGKDDDAARQMREVQQLAEEALKEVRAVVAGYRDVDLATELEGARTVLAAAGIRTRVVGSADDVDPAHAVAVAWAVREGVTNVVRHADATQVKITLGSDARATTLVVENDGARAEATGASRGSGLLGLAERLRPLGGTVNGERAGGTYRLAVTLPKEDA